MNILGITAPISENTAACVLVDGKLLAFAEEERFNRVKHAPRMIPRNAIEYCLKEAGLNIGNVDFIAVGYESIGLSWTKDILTNIWEGNWGKLIPENGAYLEYFTQIMRLKRYFLELDKSGKTWKKMRYINHHLAHAASTARFSGFRESVVISLDGVGENNAGLFGYFRGGKIYKIKTVPMNQSLGWLYGNTTEICGFKKHSHEGKLMGLAAYGNVKPELLRGIAELREGGYLLRGGWVKRLEKRFKRGKRDEEIGQEHKDLAATVQNFLEEAVARVAKNLHQETKIRNVSLAGGVALNCDMNAKIIALDCFDNIFIQPAVNDAGTALGAAAEVYFQETEKSCEKLAHAYFGPDYSSEKIEEIFKESKLKYRKISGISEVAKMLIEGKIVGWFSGRMEFGPRALGGRSILANPALPGMKDKINNFVKHREDWRPFAPSILKEYAEQYFEDYYPSPFMLLTFKTRSEKKQDVQAAIHVDQTARVQEVSKETNPRYHELISEFHKISGIPALLNTSFNDRGEPICMSPKDAIRIFYSTGLDALVIEDFIIEKS
jgi:carbamoyltransferase